MSVADPCTSHPPCIVHALIVVGDRAFARSGRAGVPPLPASGCGFRALCSCWRTTVAVVWLQMLSSRPAFFAPPVVRRKLSFRGVLPSWLQVLLPEFHLRISVVVLQHARVRTRLRRVRRVSVCGLGAALDVTAVPAGCALPGDCLISRSSCSVGHSPLLGTRRVPLWFLCVGWSVPASFSCLGRVTRPHRTPRAVFCRAVSVAASGSYPGCSDVGGSAPRRAACRSSGQVSDADWTWSE